MSRRDWMWPVLAAGLVSSVLVGLLSWPALFYPLGSDQGTFAYGGRVLLSGGMLYRDAADTKPPGIFLLYALADFLFNSEGAYRKLEPFLLLLAAIPLYSIFRRLGWKTFAVTIAFFSVWYFAGLSYWDLGQVELPAAVVALFYVAILLNRPAGASRTFDFLSGVLPGILFLLKQHFILLGLLFVFVLFRDERPKPGIKGWFEKWPILLPHALGALSPLAALFIWFSARGAGVDLLRGLFVWPWLYARHASLPGESILYYSGTLLLHLPAVLLIGAGLIQVWRQRAERDAGILLAAVTLMLFCSLLQRKLWTYHLVFFLPGLALLAGAGAQRLSGKGRIWPHALVVVVLVLDFFSASTNMAHKRERDLAPANNYIAAWERSVDLVRGKISTETYLEGFASYLHPRDGLAPLHRPVQDWRAAQMIQKSCPQGGSLQVIEFRPAVYILAGRTAPHRYFFWSLPSLLGRGGKQMQEEMMRLSYSEKRPDCILFGAGAHWDSPQALEFSPARFGYEAADSIVDDPSAGVRMVLFVNRKAP